MSGPALSETLAWTVRSTWRAPKRVLCVVAPRGGMDAGLGAGVSGGLSPRLGWGAGENDVELAQSGWIGDQIDPDDPFVLD